MKSKFGVYRIPVRFHTISFLRYKIIKMIHNLFYGLFYFTNFEFMAVSQIRLHTIVTWKIYVKLINVNMSLPFVDNQNLNKKN